MSGPATGASAPSNRDRGSTASRLTSTCAATTASSIGSSPASSPPISATSPARGGVPLLVCWENAADIEAGQSWCRRHIVAQWLERGLGIEVAEVGYEDRALDRWAFLRANGVEPPMP